MTPKVLSLKASSFISRKVQFDLLDMSQLQLQDSNTPGSKAETEQDGDLPMWGLEDSGTAGGFQGKSQYIFFHGVLNMCT